MEFRPADIACFEFADYCYDPQRCEASLVYRLHGSDGRRYEFVERFLFHGARRELDAESLAVLNRTLRALHLAAGVSYYKAAVPPQIEICGDPLTARWAAFFESLYLHGLAEFAYQNQLSLQERVRFPHSDPALEHMLSGRQQAAVPQRQANSNRLVVPIGGGKDSLVTVEIAKRHDPAVRSIFVGDQPIFFELAARIGVPHIHISRTISPQLIELNRCGAFNGHVPISAILAFALLVAAPLYEFDTIAISQERSANAANVIHQGREVNHQYSKSLAFEMALARFLDEEVAPGVKYFSLLRPLSEVSIAQLFARYSQYHDLFSSCNRTFSLSRATEPGDRWCGTCPKCRFVFLALAPVMERAALVRIFGRDLLADPEQCAGYEALLGYGQHKPFECVGEVEESAALFYTLAQDSRWADAVVVRKIADQVLPHLAFDRSHLAQVRQWSDDHLVPEPYLRWVQDAFAESQR